MTEQLWMGLTNAQKSGHAAILVTITDTGGSTPRLSGAQLLITKDTQIGTVGGGAFEYAVIQKAHDILQESSPSIINWYQAHLVHELGMCCGGKMTAMLHYYPATPKLWIFGAGHVGTALANLCSTLELKLIIVDEREEWLHSGKLPIHAEMILEDPETLVQENGPMPDDLVVITTHDHGLDERLISLLAPRNIRYLGMIGSAGKWGRFKKRLKERGLTDEEMYSVRTPIGLSIGAQTPAELAVSIAAELIQVLRRANE